MDREDTHEQDARDHRRAPVASPDPGREQREADDRAERGHGDRQLEGALGFIRSELQDDKRTVYDREHQEEEEHRSRSQLRNVPRQDQEHDQHER